jgi:tartrate-resistant acid phosphatase type 5
MWGAKSCGPWAALGCCITACAVEEGAAGRAEPIRAATLDALRLAVIGDTGTGDPGQWETQRALRAVCAANGCDAVLIVGDALYPAGMRWPHDELANERIGSYATIAPTYVLLGNHDYGRGRDVQAADWMVEWSKTVPGVHLPSRRWTADLELSGASIGRLVALDTNTVFYAGPETQGPWLYDELESVNGWRIVAGHHPYRSSGPHGNAGAYEGWRFVPWLSGRGLNRLFERDMCGLVDLYLAGHDHHLEVIDACGVVHVVSGAGASVRATVDRGNEPSFSSAELGFVWLALGPEHGELRVFGADGGERHRQELTRSLRVPR